MTDTPYRWRLTRDLDDFRACAEGFLGGQPALNTVLLSVTDTLRLRGVNVYGDQPPVFGVLEAGGEVRGALLMTAPHRLLLSPLDLVPSAAESLAELLAAELPGLPGVGAEAGTAREFAAAWARRTGAAASVEVHQRLYRLGTLTPPDPAPAGRARVAGEADRAQLECWYREFHRAVGGPPGMDPADWVSSRLAYDGLTLWETPDGTPVSLAGRTRLLAGQVRIAPVYTPAGQRGRGYAGAVTGHVSAAARAEGAGEVLLFTDLANPTSNALYRRIGYRGVRDFVTYGFGGVRVP